MAEDEFPGNCSISYLSLAMVALDESVGGAYGSRLPYQLPYFRIFSTFFYTQDEAVCV